MLLSPPISTLFPYTTLFRSRGGSRTAWRRHARSRASARSHSYRPPPPGAAPRGAAPGGGGRRSEEHTSELQSLRHLVCRLLLEKKKNKKTRETTANTYSDTH